MSNCNCKSRPFKASLVIFSHFNSCERKLNFLLHSDSFSFSVSVSVFAEVRSFSRNHSFIAFRIYVATSRNLIERSLPSHSASSPSFSFLTCVDFASDCESESEFEPEFESRLSTESCFRECFARAESLICAQMKLIECSSSSSSFQIQFSFCRTNFNLGSNLSASQRKE